MSVPPPLRTFLESRALKDAGFRHGFSTRAAGDATARDRAALLHVGATRLSQATQVHGDVVVDAGLPADTKADALVATVAGDAVGIRVADCVPILLAAPDGHVAAVHAGWRGVANGIVGKAIARLGASSASAFLASVGPHIGPCCFEVGPEVVPQIGEAFVDRYAPGSGGVHRAFINLREAVHAQLKAAGIAVIDDVGACTKCDAATYHSFRRDADESGRMIAVIAAK